MTGSAVIDTHNIICDFGRHSGTPYTRLPVNYLKWMVCIRHHHADIADAELKRRGTVTPDLDVSGHAIDRASLNCRKIWHQTSKPDEGLHAWLVRVSGEALAAGDIVNGKYRHIGMLFALEQDGVWPVLKTVMREKEKTPCPAE